MKKIVLIANKSWEVEPLLNAMLNKQFRPPGYPLPDPIYFPREQQPVNLPRAIYKIASDVVEIWCLQDLMNPDPKISSSSSAEKMRVLPQIFKNGDATLVVAFGTAGFTGLDSYNGSVVIGTNVFIHNPYHGKPNPASDWDDPRLEKVIPSSVTSDVFIPSPKGNIINTDFRLNTESRFIYPPNNPALRPMVIAASNYTAVGTVNVTNYDNYTWADPESLAALKATGERVPVGSVETTHGLIRLQSEAPFIFISGITDRLGYFNMEVSSNGTAQNFAAAFNGGVVAAWLIPRLLQFT
jgi:hypothetical protein